MNFFIPASQHDDMAAHDMPQSTESDPKVSNGPTFTTKLVNAVSLCPGLNMNVRATYFSQTCSIAQIWAPVDPTAPIKLKKPEPRKICQHLSGPEYDGYIRLIRTRTLGGVSPELRARAARQLFPYKQLPPLEKEPKAKNLDVVFIEINAKVKLNTATLSIPDDGNSRHNEKQWTQIEKRKLDGFLLGWARWEVDFVNGFVKSARCEGTTGNVNAICDACTLVSKDESLKRSIRRVSNSIFSVICY
jgi:hypothetical protein